MNSDLYPPRFTLTEFHHGMNFIMTSNELLFSLILSSHKLRHFPLHNTINVTSNATNTLNGCQRCFRGYIFERRQQQMVQLSSPFLKMLWWIRETRRSSRALLMVSRCEMLHILCTLSSYFTLPNRLLHPNHCRLISTHLAKQQALFLSVVLLLLVRFILSEKNTLKLIPSVSYQQQKWKARNAEREFEVKTTNLFIQNIYESSPLAHVGCQSKKKQYSMAASGWKSLWKCSQHFLMWNYILNVEFFRVFRVCIHAVVAVNNALGHRTVT